LDQTEEMKYLEIHFDKKFNSVAHIDYTVPKSITLANRLS